MNEPTKAMLPVSDQAKQVTTGALNPIIWEQLKGMANTFVQSKALAPTENAATLLVKMQAGQEMGMAPIESIKSFYFVNGTINIFGAAVSRRLREHGWEILFKDEANKCTATIKKGKEEYSDTLTFEEAEKSKWTKDRSGNLKPGWYEGANRKLKLRYGVISMLVKTYVPEVLGSAVDIAEVAMDVAPTIMEYKEEVSSRENEAQGEPATPEMIDLLTKKGVEFDPATLTKEQGAKLIAEAIKPKSKKKPKQKQRSQKLKQRKEK